MKLLFENSNATKTEEQNENLKKNLFMEHPVNVTRTQIYPASGSPVEISYQTGKSDVNPIDLVLINSTSYQIEGQKR